MADQTPTRRQADHALIDLQTGVADLQGGQSEVIKRVDRLDYAVFGIPDTDEKGLLGEIREVNDKLGKFFLTFAIGAAGIVVSGISIAVAIVLNG